MFDKKAWSKQYRKDNKEKIKAYCKKNKKHIASQKQKWAENNREKTKASFKKHYQNNREEVKKQQRIYSQSSMGRTQKSLSFASKRIAKTNKQKIILVSVALVKYIAGKINKYKVCPFCKSKNPPSIDHIKPIEKGGRNTKKNIQLICMKCNSKKGDSLDPKWNSKK